MLYRDRGHRTSSCGLRQSRFQASPRLRLGGLGEVASFFARSRNPCGSLSLEFCLARSKFIVVRPNFAEIFAACCIHAYPG